MSAKVPDPVSKSAAISVASVYLFIAALILVMSHKIGLRIDSTEPLPTVYANGITGLYSGLGASVAAAHILALYLLKDRGAKFLLGRQKSFQIIWITLALILVPPLLGMAIAFFLAEGSIVTAMFGGTAGTLGYLAIRIFLAAYEKQS
jgi:hypothetical protein